MSKRSKALRYYKTYRPEGVFKKSLRFILRLVVTLFILYQIMTVFLIESYAVKDGSGDTQRIIATPLLYGPEISLIDYRFPPLKSPHRGDLVLVDMDTSQNLKWYAKILNSFSRFFTLNRFEFFRQNSDELGSRLQLMRVLGVPGDQVKLEDFRVKIKTSGKSFFLDEREVLLEDYSPVIPEQSEIIQEDFPYSGDQGPLSIEEGEYLLVPDRRASVASSMLWRETGFEKIKSQVLLSFWPEFRMH